MQAHKIFGRRLAVVWLFGVVLTAPSFAQAEGYVGAGAGQSKAKDISTLPAGSSDDTDTAWDVFGGFMFNRAVGLELSYIDFGKFTGSAPGASVEAKPKGVDLSVIGVLPLADRFSLFGKVGANRWKVDTDASALGISASQSDKGTDLSYGVGARYDFTRNFGGRLEWQKFKDVGDEDTTGQSDIDVIALNFVYNFH